MIEIEVTHEPHIINSLDDVVNLLDKALNDELDHFDLKIEELKDFSMHLVGKKFHQTITPSVMKGFIDLQSAIYRSYAQIKYDDTSILRLTKIEKDELELEVKVIDGSSGFGFDWQEVLSKIVENTVGKMNSKQAFISVLVLILSFAGYSTTKEYLTAQKETRLAEIANEKDSNEKQERLATIALLTNNDGEDTSAILEKAAKVVPSTTAITEEAKYANHSLIKSAQAAEIIEFNDGEVKLSGDAARELTKTSPSKWADVRVDGIYHVINVDSSHSAKRKIRIRNIETQEEMLAVLENDTLDQKYLDIIQDAEWGYVPVELRIRAKELNGRYKEAEILQASKLKK